MSELSIERRDDGIAVVTLNRPEKRNAVTAAMWRDLAETFHSLDRDPEARAIVLTGAGEHFSGGADIAEFGRVRDTAEQARIYSGAVHAAEAAITHVAKPTVAAIRGYAVGGGCALTLCCDFRMADPTARMGIPAARLSIVYGIESTRALVNVVGYGNAKRILFTGERFDAGRARAMGLVDEIVDGDVVDAAVAFAAGMAENAPLSIQGAKLAINALAEGTVASHADAFADLARRSAESEDYSEGRRAFLEKRRPRFTGR